MLDKLVIFLFINVLIKTSAQYYPNPYQNYQNMAQRYYQQEQQQYDDYDAEPSDYRRYNGRGKMFGSSGGILPTVGYDYEYETYDSKCSCSRCENPKPRCRDYCARCPQAHNQAGQGGIFLVPYPYPLMVPNVIQNDTTTSITTTSTERTTSITEMVTTQKSEHVENDAKSQNMKAEKKYMLTAFRKTKPTWEPNYGIVPIPDNLAEKIMSQLRNVKKLQVKRYY